MSGKAAIVPHNHLSTWLIKFYCKPREVVNSKKIVAASGLRFLIMPHIILEFSRTKWTRRQSGPALWGKVQPIGRGHCSATHRERTLYWILGKFFSNALPASYSITHKRVDAENIGFLHQTIDLDTLIEQEDAEILLLLKHMPSCIDAAHIELECPFSVTRPATRACPASTSARWPTCWGALPLFRASSAATVNPLSHTASRAIGVLDTLPAHSGTGATAAGSTR